MSAHGDAAEVDDDSGVAIAATEAADKAAPRTSQRQRRLPVRELDGACSRSPAAPCFSRFADTSAQTFGLRCRQARRMRRGAMHRWTRWTAARRSSRAVLCCFTSQRRLKVR
jgi:hypothetical protein